MRVANLPGGVLALGEEWWVLDRALRLYHELGEKKGREILLLRELRNWYLSFPEGPVFARECPDFMVDTAGGRIGLEITECLRGDGRHKKGSRYRERWQAEEKVKRLAEALYYGGPEGRPKAAEPVWVNLHWAPASSQPERLPQSVEEIAAAVARLVRGAEPEWRDGRRLEMRPKRLVGTVLEGVLAKLTVRREAFRAPDGRAPGWTASRAYPTEIAEAGEVAAAIGAKDRVYDRCAKACDEAWLVVALVGGVDSFQEVSKDVFHHPFRSYFDRVLLLCLDGGPGMRRVFEPQKARS